MASAVVTGRCLITGCKAPLFQGTMCFEHLRLDRLKKTAGDAVRKPIRSTANKGTIDELLVSVKTQPSFGKMLSYSLECLTKLAVSDVTAEEIIDAGAVQALDAAMALHPNDEKLHRQYMETLRVLSMNSRLAGMVGEQCGSRNFSKLCHSLRNHNDVETHISTAKAIAALAADDTNMHALADQGLLDALADAVKRNPNNHELLAAAAKVFARFAEAKPEYAAFVTSSGALEVIMNGMKNTTNLDLAKNGAELLAILAGSSGSNINHLKAIGAVDALIHALEMFPHDKQLELAATRALALLTGEDDMLRALAVTKGNMALDLKTAKSLSTISSLLLVPHNVETMFRESGVEWLIALLMSASDGTKYDANGNKIAELALRSLTRSAIDENRIYDILSHNGVQVLLSVLSKYDDIKVIAEALGFLGKLVQSREENVGFIVGLGGINATLRAYAMNPNTYEIVRPALNILYAAAQFESAHYGLVQSGAIEALVDMFRRHMHDIGIVTDVVSTLGRLATSEDIVKRMGAAGYIPLLLDSLKRFMTDPAFVKLGLLALETCAMVPDHLAILLPHGAVEVVRAIMGAYPNDQDIQSIGSRALALLLKAQTDKEAEQARLEALEAARREAARLKALAAAEKAERDRIEREMQEALMRLKLQDEADAARRRKEEAEEKKRKWDEELRLKQMRLKQQLHDAEVLRLQRLVGPSTLTLVQPVKPTHRSVRALFEGEEDYDQIFELDPQVKQFLLAGQVLIKHGSTGMPSSRHVFLTQECTHIIWNKPMTDIHAKHTMLITQIYGVTRGHCTPQLQRVRFGTKLAGHPDLCFSINGASAIDGKERTVDLECKSSSDREKWIQGIEQLIRWCKSKKLYGADTITYNSTERVKKKATKELGEDGADGEDGDYDEDDGGEVQMQQAQRMPAPQLSHVRNNSIPPPPPPPDHF